MGSGAEREDIARIAAGPAPEGWSGSHPTRSLPEMEPMLDIALLLLLVAVFALFTSLAKEVDRW